MNTLHQGILTLIKSAITGEKYQLPEGFDLDAEETKKLIKKHHLMLLVYIGALNCGISNEIPCMQALYKFYGRHFIYSENQMMQVQRIYQAFEKHGIDYLPTKGCVLKAIYPKPEMRSMGDADITIRKEQCAQIKEIMLEMGYTVDQDNEVNLVMENKFLHVEFHLWMRSFYNEKYYEDIWERTHPEQENGHRYVFGRIEDQYIHIFNHFARHYRIGGIGCRHLTDVYVMRLKYPEMDEAYIRQELEKISLHKFHENVMEVLDVWYGEGTFTPVTKQISDYIFECGNWGSEASHAAANMVAYANESGKTSNFRLREIFKTIFPGVEYLKEKAPILEKAPYLLPLMWLRRWFTAIFIKAKYIPELLRTWGHIDDENVLEFQDHYQFVGLDIKK